MKIKLSQLRKIINEELRRVILEQGEDGSSGPAKPLFSLTSVEYTDKYNDPETRTQQAEIDFDGAYDDANFKLTAIFHHFSVSDVNVLETIRDQVISELGLDSDAISVDDVEAELQKLRIDNRPALDVIMSGFEDSQNAYAAQEADLERLNVGY